MPDLPLPSSAKNLLWLRTDRGLDQKDMAAIAKVDPTTYGRWERGETEPRVFHLVNLARELKVSVDFLAGLSDYPSGLAPDTWIVDPAAHARAKANPKVNVAWSSKVPRDARVVDHDEYVRLKRELGAEGEGA